MSEPRVPLLTPSRTFVLCLDDPLSENVVTIMKPNELGITAYKMIIRPRITKGNIEFFNLRSKFPITSDEEFYTSASQYCSV